MYKCRLVYDEWKSMIKKSRIGTHERSSDFCGYVGLLTIDEVSDPQVWENAGVRFTVLDSGYKWLSIMPENDYYCITVMMDAEYEDGDISEEQYNRAIYTAETLKQGLLKDYGEYQSFVSDRLKLVEKCLRTL